MSTSPLEGFVRTEPTAEFAPVSAARMRQVALNNALHAADEHAQVRVNWMAPAVGGGQGYIATRASPTASVYYRIASFGPFPVSLREVGRTYYLRVRVAGISSAGHSVAFRVVISPVHEARGWDSYASAPGDHVYSATTSSTTPGWLTGASLGSEALDTMAVVDAVKAERWTRSTDTLADVSGAHVGVSQCLVSANVLASTSNASSVPRLYGLYIAEYVGQS